MTSKNFEENDLVWAKMKGFPPWPGKVTVPPADTKPKKNHHYIFFYGSENYAWISNDCIDFHNESMVEKYGKRKGELFRKAVETIVDCSKGVSKYHTLMENNETHNENASKVTESRGKLDKSTKDAPPSKKKSSRGSSSVQKIKNKSSMKKVAPVKTSSVKKNTRKRAHSSDHLESSSEIFKSDPNAQEAVESEAAESEAAESEAAESEAAESEAAESEAAESKPSTSSLFFLEDLYFYDPYKVRPTKKKIGFIGLCKIGQGLVRNLLKHGHNLVVWNESFEAKAFAEEFKIKTVATPAEVVEDADITLCYISDSDATKEIVERDSGVLEGMERSRGRKKGFVELSSIDPKVSHEIASLIAMKGGFYLEAPICRSNAEADEWNYLILAAGDKMLYDDCKSCFDSISNKHDFVSAEVGTASKLDIIHNMFIGTVYASLAESLSLLDKAGDKVTGEDFYTVLETTGLNSESILHKLRAMIGQNCVKDETKGTTLNQMQQHFKLGLSIGHEVSQHTKVFAQANELYKHCKSKNLGDHDVSALYLGTKK